MVKGDLWDKESLKNALKGSEVVYGVCILIMSSCSDFNGIRPYQITNFYDPSIAGTKNDGEIDQGKKLIDACKDVGVKFFVWRFVTP